MDIIGHGVYGLSEAARLTGLRPHRVREWFRVGAGEESRPPVFRSDYQSIGGDRAISFYDLIEVFVAGQLRDHQVSMQSLRKVHEQLQKDLRTEHPFCRREILTKHGQVFTRGLDEQGREELIEVLTRQRVFPEILLPFLSRIDYDDATEMAKRWCIADMVVIDPGINFGKPIVEDVGISTSILASAYRANRNDEERVGAWYNINPRHVLAAVDFERSLAA